MVNLICTARNKLLIKTQQVNVTEIVDLVNGDDGLWLCA